VGNRPSGFDGEMAGADQLRPRRSLIPRREPCTKRVLLFFCNQGLDYLLVTLCEVSRGAA
jgi:hypothetical protein